MSPREDRQLVCFVIERLANRSGGAERIVIELANHLASTGRRVHLLSYEREGGEPFYELARGVTHFNLKVPPHHRHPARRIFDRLRDGLHARGPHPRLLRGLLWHSKRGGFVRALELHLRLHVPGVVVAVAPPAMVTLARVQVDHPLRRIASLHNVPALDLESVERWDRNPLDLVHRRASLATFDAITVLQPSFVDWFDEALKPKLHVVPNPVYPAPRREFSERERVVLCVGRLAVPKRVEILIEAWARLKDRFPDWRVEVFGEGLLQKRLHRRIKSLELGDAVRLLGHTKDIHAQYARASILAHPAKYEGWGLSVSEALARAVPCVAFADCPGVSELIVHEGNGLLVSSVGDLGANFAEALARLIQDEELRRRLGTAGPPSMQRFAPEVVQSKWESIIDG